MHTMFIAHRDLKPENFLLANEKDVMVAPLKIIDFGLSRRCAGSSRPDDVLFFRSHALRRKESNGKCDLKILSYAKMRDN